MNDVWTITRRLTPLRRLAVLDLINRTEVELGREALDENRRRGVIHDWPGEHWLKEDGGLRGYAHVTDTQVPCVEMCGGGLDQDLLAGVLAVHPVVDWWLRDSPGHAHAMRTIRLMTRPLPAPRVEVPDGARIRHFRPGLDDEAWLALNNAAFPDHPEQGEWSQEDLEARTREPWFDPSGFVLLEIDGELAASCWTKVHELHPDRPGEIYVISVDPRFQRRGLGRIILSEGLATLRSKGVSTAMLFVDASHESATSLYEHFGFDVAREDQILRFYA
jgi:mycothiol synthase